MATPRSSLDDLEIFIVAAREKNLGLAARALGLPKSTVSRRLALLETRLGVRLLERIPTGLRVTDSGERLHERVAGALHDVRDAEREVVEGNAAPRGQLRVSAPYDFAIAHGVPLVQAFQRVAPEVDVRLFLTDRQVDLAVEGFDVAIRIGALKDTSVVARPIGKIRGELVASPSYLRAQGTPARPADLEAHAFVVFDGLGRPKSLRLHGPRGEVADVVVRGLFSVNSLALVRDAAIAGMGIARAPSYVVAAAQTARLLVRVLPDWNTGERTIHVAYLGRRKLPARAGVFVDFLTAYAVDHFV